MSKNSKICPLLSIAMPETVDFQPCIEEKCSWYCKNTKCCAILTAPLLMTTTHLKIADQSAAQEGISNILKPAT